MNILDKIVAYKKMEVEGNQAAIPVSNLAEFTYYGTPCRSMTASLKQSTSGIIAEHKRRSPSRSVINDKSDLPDVIQGYQQAGVSAISVLTDTRFFGGSLTDLLLARSISQIPLLRKDFTIHPYQIHEAKAYGADAILLIAAILDRSQIQSFSGLAHQLGMEVLLEVHHTEELIDQDLSHIDMVGVNNRNLKSFTVNLDNSRNLASSIPDQVIKISESGLSDPRSVQDLRKFGYKGFLMGESFMKQEDPGTAAAQFIAKI